MAENTSEKNKDYGLPKVEPQPIMRDQGAVSKNPWKPATERKKNDQRSIIITLAVVGLLILASLLFMIFWNSESENTGENPAEDRVVLDPDESEGEELINIEDTPETAEDSQLTDEPGSIITISQRTNRYYIFVGSYKFRAYAHRHAEKLAADGFAVKLISPDNWVGMRVAVGNYANETEAGNDAQTIRSRYGNEVVISKY
jgi:hypothetical protein